MTGVKEDKKNKVCSEVLKSSRYKLFLELRFLEPAIFRLVPEEQERIFFGSDGEKLYYDRDYLLNRYLEMPDAVTCDYLHTVIHCLYQHPFQAGRYQERYWNLASDIATADVLREIDVPWILEQLPQECLEIVDCVKEEVTVMSAPHIAGYLERVFGRENGLRGNRLREGEPGLCGYDLTELEELFQRDSHVCWSIRKEKEKGEGREASGGEGEYEEPTEPETDRERDGEPEDGEGRWEKRNYKVTEDAADGAEKRNYKVTEDAADGAEKRSDKAAEDADDRAEKRNGEAAEDSDDRKKRESERDAENIDRETEPENGKKSEKAAKGRSGGMRTEAQMERLSNEWKEAAESVALHAKSFAKERGSIPGNMLLAIQRLTREQYDYTEFLKRFAVMDECMKVNQDEFDYIYYLYGLRILKKIPLIEPLEYKEELQIKEFVVAIDTSGSCSGELVQRFLNKTYNILCQSECFSNQIVLHILQCDAAIQEDVRIDSLEHLEEYISSMTLRGGGGTDFRPVFDYVGRLCGQGEFKRLCGLIYFTDGYGVFPAQPPDYKTAFVFVEREDDVRVPPWAIRIYLENV